MVFQHFNLFPHMTILENMTLAPVKLLGKSRQEAEGKALALLDRVGLADRHDHDQVDGRHRQQGHEGLEGPAPDDLPALGQVDDAGVTYHRSLLQQDDELIGQGGTGAAGLG